MKRWFTAIIVLFVFVADAQLYRNEWIDYSKTYYKFKVSFGIHPVTILPIRQKLVRINQPTLVSAGLGSVQAQHFQLFRNGVEVPIYVSTPTGILTASDYIEFWGEINDGKLDRDLYRDPENQLSDLWSLQEDAGTYFLTTNTSGTVKRLAETTNDISLASGLTPTVFFMSTERNTPRQRRYEGFGAQAALKLFSSSYDRGEGYCTREIRPIGSACGQVSFSVSFTNLRPHLAGPPMSVKTNTVGGGNNPRSVLVRLNGTNILNYQMDYQYDAKIEEMGIPVNLINTGTATFQYINQSSVSCDEFRLCYTELTYPRTLDCNNQASLTLNFPASFTSRYLSFFNFPAGGTPILYDLTNGKRYVGNTAVTDSVRFVIEPSLTAHNLVLVNATTTEALTITSLQQRNFTNYSVAANQGDYLIISNPLIYGTGSENYIEQYRAYRSSVNGGNYNAKIVNIEELTDQFAYGIAKHPLSIRNFLRYARNQFSVAPKYVFIIGKGLNYLHYRNNENAADIAYQNLVPTWGHPASDNLLSAADNENPTPVTPIGRLSAVSAQEVGDYFRKIKQYDSLQRLSTQTVAEKAWMKNVLHVAGANDYNISTQLDEYLTKYKTIIAQPSFGAKPRNFDKLSDPSAYTQSLRDFKNIFESGTSLITYFGHSSATALDFNLDNPSAYDNQYKYPVFIVNGCDAGNFYQYESQRLSLKTTLSEKFVLAPQRGAIGYLATTNYGVVNYLDTFTTKFYRAINDNNYNKPFGDVIKTGISDVLGATGTTDFFARFHAEQFTFHGDPALKLNVFEKPDYTVEASFLTATPSFISVAKDSFRVKIKYFNLGKKIADSIAVKVERQLPSGNSMVVYNQRRTAIAAEDSMVIAMPIVPSRDKGNHTITVTLDPLNTVSEITKANNTTSIDVTISDDDIVPVYPYNYAIVNNTNITFTASTANALALNKTYTFELDTTALFNSTQKIQVTKPSTGGVVEFTPAFTPVNGRTYYWRVKSSTGTEWNMVSFTYKNQTNVGFTQQHVYQHFDNEFERIGLDSATAKLSYGNKLNNLFVIQSVYPTSGLNDQDFSIQVNGTGSIASACLGNSVIINSFDTLTFKPIENLTNPFGAAATCADSRKYNFEYHYISATGRNNAKQFLESLPNGSFLTMRLIYDGTQIWAPDWAADEATYGTGNTLYHFLKKHGLPIDSFNKPRTFVFIFRKNDTVSFKPKWAFSEGIYDRIYLNADFQTKDTVGYVTSPKYGPARAWKNVKFSGQGNANSKTQIYVSGITAQGDRVRLFTLDTLQNNFDISSINATTYPYVQLQMFTQDSVTTQPYQLKSWGVEYTPVPELAVAPNVHYTIPDTAGIFSSIASDTLRGSVAYKNVSRYVFTDSLPVKLVLINARLGTTYQYNLPKIRPLNFGDTAHVRFAIRVANFSPDDYMLRIAVNEDSVFKEQFIFNNFLYKNIYLKTDAVVPVQLTSFTAKPKAQTVDVIWLTATETNVQLYTIEHSTNAINFTKLGSVRARGSNNSYNYNHVNPAQGKNYYRLQVVHTDGSISYSPIRMVSFGTGVRVNVYPNPTNTFINISVSKTDDKPVTAKLYSIYGQLLLQQTFMAQTQLNVQQLALGTYLLQIDDGNTIQTFNIQKQ